MDTTSTATGNWQEMVVIISSNMQGVIWSAASQHGVCTSTEATKYTDLSSKKPSKLTFTDITAITNLKTDNQLNFETNVTIRISQNGAKHHLFPLGTLFLHDPKTIIVH